MFHWKGAGKAEETQHSVRRATVWLTKYLPPSGGKEKQILLMTLGAVGSLTEKVKKGLTEVGFQWSAALLGESAFHI